MPPLPQRHGSHLQVVIVIAIVLTTQTARGNIAADDNVRERGALCGLIELANGRAALESSDSQLGKDMADLLELNMSLADSSWLDIFRQTDAREKPRDFPEAEFREHKDWPGRWPKWKTAAESLLKADGQKEALTKHKLQAMTQEQRVSIRAAVARITAEAEAIESLATADAPETHLLNDEKLKTLLNEQIYGGNPDAEPPAAATKLFTSPTASNRAGYCDGTTQTNAAKTVTVALICICTADQSKAGSEQKACEHTTGLTTDWNAASAPPATVISQAVKLCDLKTKHKLSAASLESRLAAVTGLIARKSGQATLGKTINGACTGKEDGGMCVKYSNLGTGSTDKVTDIPWVGGLSAIATQLRQHEEAVKIRKEAARQLKAKKQLVQALLYTERPQQIETAKHDKNAPETEKVTKNCAVIEKATECRKNGNCKWTKETDETGKHCELNTTAAAQQATQAGTGGTQTGKKCYYHTKKEACEAENKNVKADEKSVCGWIEEKCKGSCFDLDKKLALIGVAL
uniref:Variant surface glycoprotein 1125.456 n=1 Tax=Trypanosoma brucei TaxID=5691 RepID=A0A1J0R5X9_9TRYP|nr:variant surface glycoprotein 1125.456 [Trypanosoma brucei]